LPYLCSKKATCQKLKGNISIGLDEKNVPTTIHWQADDAPDAQEPKACKAMLLSLFDENERDTLRIDLWTDGLQVVEMDRFMYHTLKGMADTYYNATKNTELANEMRKFVEYFGERTEIIPKEG
jgi:gliding motility-associated protein GldC